MATGTSLSQPPVTLINLNNAFTKKYYEPKLPDSTFKPSPFWWSVAGAYSQRVFGGGALVWGPVTAEETAGGAYWGTQVADTTPSDPISPAELQWRAYRQPIVIPVLDQLLNMGEGQVLPIDKIKYETAMGSLLQKLGRGAFGTSPNNTAIDLDSLPTALAGSGTYAGITIGTPWECNGGAGPSSGGAVSLDNMMTDYMNATQGNEMPDRIFTTLKAYQAFWSLLTQQQRQVEDADVTRAGFKMHLHFNNAVVFFDAFVPAGEMEMITRKYCQGIFHPSDYFTCDPFMQPSNQRVIVSYIYLLMNLRFFTLRQHSRRTGITNG